MLLRLLGGWRRGQWGRLVGRLAGCRWLRGQLGQCWSDGLDTSDIDTYSAIFDKKFDHAVVESAQDEMWPSPVRREFTIPAQVVCFVEPHHLSLPKLVLLCCVAPRCRWQPCYAGLPAADSVAKRCTMLLRRTPHNTVAPQGWEKTGTAAPPHK